MSFTAAIVTSCTQRKSGDVHVDIAQLPDVGGLKSLADTWRRLVAAAPTAGPAATLYQGRSIAETATAATLLSTRWYVVSAGLGLVPQDQPVPAYECSVATGSKLNDQLLRLGATVTDWWAAMTDAQPHPLSKLIKQGPTLVALPSSYLRMVSGDLLRVTASQARNLRIFTSTAGAAVVPVHLLHCVMPYDDRLESVPGHAGTKADFAQRALRHFVEKLEAADTPLDEARVKVASALSGRPWPSRPIGVRMSDEQIKQTLRAQWSVHDGRSTRLLRYLRDEAGISCEQKRFSRIWQSLVAELEA